MKNKIKFYSLASLILIGYIFFWTSFDLKKWEKHHILIWDVSGYYLYLPSVFIYDDIKTNSFLNNIEDKYRLSGKKKNYGILKLINQNTLFKFTMGMSILYAPFFFIADIYVNYTNYPGDGYSIPYQFMIAIGSIFYALIGLLILRKILLNYFKDISVAFTLIIIALGTNYFYYVTYEGAMPHNYLFTIYCAIIFFTIKWYESYKIIYALLLGGLIGLATLIRPTELLTVLIPILWGISSKSDLSQKIKLILEKKSHVLLMIIMTLMVGSLQLCYWKYITGSWVVNSYKGEGNFNFQHPAIINGLFSYKKGWLIYTPVMVISLLGIISLKKYIKHIIPLIIIFFIINIYIVFSWNPWWYGGSFGSRVLIQSYALLCFPLAGFIESLSSKNYNITILKNKITKVCCFALILFFIALNLIQSWQYKHGLIHWSDMTKEKYWEAFNEINLLEIIKNLYDD